MNYIKAKDILNIANKNLKAPSIVYILFSRKFFLKIKYKFKLKEHKFTRGRLYIEKNYHFAVIVNPGVGLSSSLMLAEELSEMGVKKVIAIGIAGAINAELKITDIFLIKSVFSPISLSQIYKNYKPELFLSKKLNKRILKIIPNLKQAKSISALTIYEEKDSLISGFLKKDISLIEMEAFYLAIVFDKNKVEFSEIVGIVDISKDKQWIFNTTNKEKVYKKLADIFLKLVQSNRALKKGN
ncbi:MAG: hypothetical protein GWO87_02830 [Xanthomonadaceae bacterium]|nr:hypothetical protein [Rhodospirillaceae bacterium]NIA18096.1 hypothetical protein [Xanthomonadaceae bacterium]